MRAKIDMGEVELATKIRAKYLRALENEEWDLLPGPTFVKSFLRTYAEYLGLDVTLMLEEYKRQHERPSDLDQLPISPHLGARSKPPRPPRVPRGWLIAAAIVALLALFAIIGSQSSNNDSPSTATTTSTTSGTAADKRRARKREKAREKARRERRRRAAARRVTSLELVPSGIVYACVTDAAGKTVVPGRNLRPGVSTGVLRSRSFKVSVGNGKVVLRVDGKDVRVPDRGSAVAYTIGPAGRVAEISATRGPTCA